MSGSILRHVGEASLDLGPRALRDGTWIEHSCECGRQVSVTLAGRWNPTSELASVGVSVLAWNSPDWRHESNHPPGMIACLDCGALVPRDSAWCESCGGPEPKHLDEGEELGGGE